MLVSGPERCTLQMHSSDAARLALQTGDQARISSRAGSVVAQVEVTDDIAPGVVSLPHGWGHDRPGVRLGVAGRHAGVNTNVLAERDRFDPLSGTAVLNGIPVTVRPATETPGSSSHLESIAARQ